MTRGGSNDLTRSSDNFLNTVLMNTEHTFYMHINQYAGIFKRQLVFFLFCFIFICGTDFLDLVDTFVQFKVIPTPTS